MHASRLSPILLNLADISAARLIRVSEKRGQLSSRIIRIRKWGVWKLRVEATPHIYAVPSSLSLGASRLNILILAPPGESFCISRTNYRDHSRRMTKTGSFLRTPLGASSGLCLDSMRLSAYSCDAERLFVVAINLKSTISLPGLDKSMPGFVPRIGFLKASIKIQITDT